VGVFRVAVDSLQAYFDFDPKRKLDLEQLDRLIRKSAPTLKRHFRPGTLPGETGMRFNMIGYGKFRYANKSGKSTDWPVVGVALQKNYISVYFTINQDNAPITRPYAGKLGELRIGQNNFSFEKFSDLNIAALTSLFAQAASLFKSDPDNAIRSMQS
jgi:hypothetical protein